MNYLEKQVQTARMRVAETYISGLGIEVGAGSRPFPLPPSARAAQGDIRNKSGLASYFSTTDVVTPDFIDAQTFAGVRDSSLDFVISAHVIEHLRDPVGAIVHAIRVLHPGGVFILVVPDRCHTFDKRRPNTTVRHVLADFSDGGESTTKDAYREHLTYVHPHLTGEILSEEEIERQASWNATHWREFDIHFHAWDRVAFEDMLAPITRLAPFRVIHVESVVNENIFVLRRRRIFLGITL
ncbi:class I SAM-dependent methyltransferase [Termitidicoccus mucosus]|uniref:class I SAM-dependent methyltransferase n=1 Tax=Termitidicoccus mucosus TaxID=1184151 RepID=UPI000A062368